MVTYKLQGMLFAWSLWSTSMADSAASDACRAAQVTLNSVQTVAAPAAKSCLPDNIGMTSFWLLA